MIPFSKPTITGKEHQYIEDAIKSGLLYGDGPFTKNVQIGLKKDSAAQRFYLLPAAHLH